MKTSYLLSAIALCSTALAGHAQSGIAFVTDMKGEAMLDAGKASLMAEVRKGARISCAKECAVGVMYFTSGKEFVLKGPGDFLVGEEEVSAKIGPPPAMRDTKWKVSTQVVAQTAQSSSASIRMRSVGAAAKAEAALPAERLVYPRDTKIASLQPGFRWASANAKGPFDFELKVAGGAKPLYKGKASALNLNLPGSVKLQPDTEYAWVVKSGSGEVGSGSFRTLPTHALEVTQKRKPDEKAPFSDWLLYALTLKEVGAEQDAADVWAKLAKTRPDLPELAALAR